nr:MAG TPA: hypothetical protein [Caudoviricetes sp.]
MTFSSISSNFLLSASLVLSSLTSLVKSWYLLLN